MWPACLSRSFLRPGLGLLRVAIGIFVGTAVDADARSLSRNAVGKVNYIQHCMGCRGARGTVVPGKVPPLRQSLGYLAALPEGRDFVVRVPGAAGSALSNAELTDVINYILQDMNAENLPPNFVFYDVEEVTRHRQNTLTNVAAHRAALILRLRALGVVSLPVDY